MNNLHISSATKNLFNRKHRVKHKQQTISELTHLNLLPATPLIQILHVWHLPDHHAK